MSGFRALEMQVNLWMEGASPEGAICWVLQRGDDEESIISSCIAYVRSAVVNKGQGTQRAVAVVITDVYTTPEHRGKGMATMLLNLLQRTLDTSFYIKIDFSLIYSTNVYGDFFRRMGWIPHPGRQMRLGLTKAALKKELPVLAQREQEWLFKWELHCKTILDMNMIKTRNSVVGDKGKWYVVMLPSSEVVRWHLIRTMAQRMELGIDDKDEAQWPHGCMLTNTETGARAWTWWTPELRQQRLYLGRLVCTRNEGLEEDVVMLLWAALIEASRLGVSEVVLWEPTKQVEEAARRLSNELGDSVRVELEEERADKVPCLRWNQGEERDTVLVDNQFSSWC